MLKPNFKLEIHEKFKIDARFAIQGVLAIYATNLFLGVAFSPKVYTLKILMS